MNNINYTHTLAAPSIDSRISPLNVIVIIIWCNSYRLQFSAKFRGPIALSYLSRGINLIALYNWPLTEHVYWIALKINITIEGSGENNFPKLAPFSYRVDLPETPFFEYIQILRIVWMILLLMMMIMGNVWPLSIIIQFESITKESLYILPVHSFHSFIHFGGQFYGFRFNGSYYYYLSSFLLLSLILQSSENSWAKDSVAFACP